MQPTRGPSGPTEVSTIPSGAQHPHSIPVDNVPGGAVLHVNPAVVAPPAAPAVALPVAPVVETIAVDKMITEGRKFIKDHTGSDDLFNLIESNVPRLVSMIENTVPDSLDLPWYSRGGLKAALWAARNMIKQSLEATLLRLIINLLKDAHKDNPAAALGQGKDVLKELLEHVAKLSNSNIEKINAKVAEIDGNEVLSADRKKVEKLALFTEIATNLIKVGLPNGKKDIILSSAMGLTQYFDVPAVVYHQIEQRLPSLLMDLSAKIAKASHAEAQNIASIKSHLAGGAELLDLIKLSTQQLNGIVNKQLFSSGENGLKDNKTTELGKLIAGLAKDLGMNTGVQFNNLVRMIGDYIQPVLIHVSAKLLADMPANDKRHVITFMVEELIKTFYTFADQNGPAIDAAYKQYKGAVANIETTQNHSDAKVREKAIAEAKKPLEALFAPLADTLMKRFGCDAASLEAILPFGGAKLAELLKSFTIEYAFQYYRDVVCVQREKPAFADKVQDYETARSSLSKVVDIVIPSIKETLADPKTQLGITLIQGIQSHLFDGKVGVSKEFFETPIAELIQTPAWANVSRSATNFLKTALIGLIGNWAVKYNAQSAVNPKNLGAAGIVHALNIVATEVKDPQLLKKLEAWKALPENTEAEKTAKAENKAVLLKLFAPAATRLLSDGGWDDSKNILAPESFKKTCKELVRDSLLPDMLFRLSLDMLIKPSTVEATPGIERLRNIGSAIYNLAKTQVHTALSEYNDLIAEQINELVGDKPENAQYKMSVREEIAVAADIEEIGKNKEPGMNQTLDFVDGMAEKLINRGLESIAAKGDQKQDPMRNVLLHLNKRMAEQNIDTKFIKKLENYLSSTSGLAKAQDDLSQLRKKGVEKYRQIQAANEQEAKSKLEEEFKGILDAIKEQQAVCKAKEKELNDNLAYKYAHLTGKKLENRQAKLNKQDEKLTALQTKLVELQKAAEEAFKKSHNAVNVEEKQQFQAELVQIQADIETLGKEEKILLNEVALRGTVRGKYLQLRKALEPFMKTLLQDMGYTQAADLPVPFFLQNTLWDSLQTVILPEVAIKLYTEATRASRQSQQHVANLRDRFEKGDKVIDAAWSFAGIGMQYLRNYLIANADEVVDSIADGLDVKFQPQPHQEGNEIVVDNQLLGQTIPKAKEFLMPAINHELFGYIVQLLDGITATLQQMEKDDPQALYKMAVALLTEMANHMVLVNTIARKHGFEHMHEVPPLVMLKEFENAGKLHPGTPGYYLQNQIAEATKKLQEAVEEKEIAQCKTDLAKLEADAAEWANTNFYRDFTMSFLRMVGINKKEDLPFRASLQEKIWKLLVEKLGPKIFSATAKKLGSSEIVNKILASALEKINENVKGGLQDPTVALRNEAVEKYRAYFNTNDQAQKTQLIQEIEGIVNEMAEKLHTKDTVALIKEIKHEAQIQETIETEANPALQKVLEKLLEQIGLALPGSWLETLTQWKHLRSLSGPKLEKLLLHALKQWTLTSLTEMAIISAAENLPKDPLPVTRDQIKTAEAEAVARNKQNQVKISGGLLDLVHHERESLEAWANSSILGAIIHWILSPLLSLIFVLLEKSVKANAPHGRKNLTNTPIHGNLAFYGVDRIRSIGKKASPAA